MYIYQVMSGGKVAGGKVGNASGAGGSQTVPVQTQCVQVSQPVLSAQQPAQAQIISPLQVEHKCYLHKNKTVFYNPNNLAGLYCQHRKRELLVHDFFQNIINLPIRFCCTI